MSSIVEEAGVARTMVGSRIDRRQPSSRVNHVTNSGVNM